MSFLESLEVFWLAVTGLCIGSFLNVVIARVPANESIVSPRSKCPKCGHLLPWYENIPVFSWLALRGKCSGCKAPISIQYPLVERSFRGGAPTKEPELSTVCEGFEVADEQAPR